MRFEARPAARNVPARTALAVMLAVLAGAAVLAFAGDGRADAASAPSIAPAADPDRTAGGNCTGPVLTRWVTKVLASEPAWALERARGIERTSGRAVVDLYFRAASGVTWLVQVREGRDCGGTLGYQDRTFWVPRENFPDTLLASPPPGCDQIHRSRQPLAVASRLVRVANAGGRNAWERHFDWRVNVTDECGDAHQEDLGWITCNYRNYLAGPRSYEIHERRVRASDNRIAYRVTETFSINCGGGGWGDESRSFTAGYWTYSLPASYQ